MTPPRTTKGLAGDDADHVWEHLVLFQEKTVGGEGFKNRVNRPHGIRLTPADESKIHEVETNRYKRSEPFFRGPFFMAGLLVTTKLRRDILYNAP